MYHHYFGLSEPAFAIAVNPKYLYMSLQHKEAIAHLLYGIQGGGFVLLSGEVGTGKTTIIRQVLNQLPENTETAFILNPMAETHALLVSICEELRITGIDVDSSIKQMMDAIQQHLLLNFSSGKRTVLIIDEAQLLSAEVLEQIRLLTNLETDTEKLLQIILVGQPEINALLAQPRLRQLSQRITARFHLTPLDEQETAQYIEHRLKIAGLKEGRTIFPRHIVKRVHRFSGGVPRLINIICERMLVGAYGHNEFQVNTKIYNLALNEIKGVKSGSEKSAFLPYFVGFAGAICIAGLVAYFIIDKFEHTEVLTENTAKIQPRSTPDPIEASVTKEPQHQTQRPSETALLSDKNPSFATNLPASENQVEKGELLFSAKSKAFIQLFQYYNVELQDESYPCWQTESHQLTCARAQMDTWQAFEELNRPAILSLVTEDKNLAYALVIGSSEKILYLIDPQGQIQEQEKEKLGTLWTGDIVYLWRKPPEYQQALSEGMRSSVVSWVAEQFANLDGQTSPITDQLFTTRLKTRVQIFQSNNGLENDGLIGERTIMKLNEKLGLSPVLIHSLPPLGQED